MLAPSRAFFRKLRFCRHSNYLDLDDLFFFLVVIHRHISTGLMNAQGYALVIRKILREWTELLHHVASGFSIHVRRFRQVVDILKIRNFHVNEASCRGKIFFAVAPSRINTAARRDVEVSGREHQERCKSERHADYKAETPAESK